MVSGETYDGGTGNDELYVSGTNDFTGTTVLSIEGLEFGTLAASSVTFTSDQIGGSNLSSALAVEGDANANAIIVNMVSPFTLDLSGWTFTDWTAPDDTITINGSTSADTIVGSSQIDTITGGLSNDSLDGRGGTDTLDGGGGDDTYILGAEATGTDTVADSSGTDTITSSITRSLADYTAIENLTLTGSANVNGTGDGGNNTITGNTGNNTLDGGDGDDVVLGGDGNDIVNGGAGDDVLSGQVGVDQVNGGDGTDTVTFSTSTTAITIDLVNNTATGGAVDTLTSIENARGGTVADILIGNAEDNILRGGGGADDIDGGLGDDAADYFEKTSAVVVTLNGSSNATVTVGGVAEDIIRNIEGVRGSTVADTLTGDANDNTFRGNGGSDTIDGGAGSDFADYNDKSSAVVVTLNGSTNATVTVGGVADDTIKNIEGVLGGSAGDTLTGDGLDNFFRGRGGNDTLDGMVGIDTALYGDKSVAVEVTLNGGTNVTVTVGGVAEDTIRNIENVNGGTADDTLTGDTLANVLTGNAGDDNLSGGGGNDTLEGNSGSDSYDGGAGDDTYVLGGAGNKSITDASGTDTISSSVTRSLAGYTMIENLTLTGADDINGTGNAAANDITGNSGDNILDGSAGDDTMTGGTGNDTYRVSTGNDTITDFRTHFLATLNGASQVPAVGSAATGQATLTLNAAHTQLDLAMTTTGLDWDGAQTPGTTNDNVNGFHVHNANAGFNGGIVWDIYGDIDQVVNAGAGTVTATWTPGDTSVISAGTFIDRLFVDGLYLNIHTAQFGSGAIRGQILPEANKIDLTPLNIGSLDTWKAITSDVAGSAKMTTTANGVTSSLTISGVAEAFFDDADFIFAGSVVQTINGTNNIDDLFGAGGNDTINGLDADDRLFGETGDDVLDGGVGVDTMIGGVGNDTYIVSVATDVVTELVSQGEDEIQTALSSYSLGALADVENLTGTASTTQNFCPGTAAIMKSPAEAAAINSTASAAPIPSMEGTATISCRVGQVSIR